MPFAMPSCVTSELADLRTDLALAELKAKQAQAKAKREMYLQISTPLESLIAMVESGDMDKASMLAELAEIREAIDL